MRLPAPLQIVVLAVLLCGGYYATCRGTGLRAPLAESNLQANLTRLEHYYLDPAPEHSIVLAGSSISGRLLPSYFEEAGLPVQNMGLDGSRPAFVFELLRGAPKLPAMLLVESAHLFDPLQENDKLLREQLQSPGFTMARHFPLLRAEYRPSGLVYTWLKSRRDARGGGLVLPPEGHWPISIIPPEYQRIWNQLADFKAKGVKVAILEVPSHAAWGVPAHDSATQLAQELDIPYLQPGVALAQRGVALEFSDGQHLNLQSARVVAQEIVNELRAREGVWQFNAPQ